MRNCHYYYADPEDQGYGMCTLDISQSCTEEALTISLPVSSSSEAASFLEHIASGEVGPETGVGTGTGLLLTSRSWANLVSVRNEYNNLLKDFGEELIKRLKEESKELTIEGLKDLKVKEFKELPNEELRKKFEGLEETKIKETATWAAETRTKIVKEMRSKMTLLNRVGVEIRDKAVYGLKSRTFDNLLKRKLDKGVDETVAHWELIQSSLKSNQGVTKIAHRASEAARYLKHGGKVMLVVSVSASLYAILRAPEEDLERVIFEELGGAMGGTLGSATVAGACLVAGVASLGSGFLACGVIGGIAGGIAGGLGGSFAANRIYYTSHRENNPSDDFIVIEEGEISTRMPLDMCF